MTNSPIFDQLSLLSLSGFRSPNLVMTQYGTLQPPVMISAGHVALWIGRTSHEFVMTIQHTYPPWNPAIPHGVRLTVPLNYLASIFILDHGVCGRTMRVRIISPSQAFKLDKNATLPAYKRHMLDERGAPVLLYPWQQNDHFDLLGILQSRECVIHIPRETDMEALVDWGARLKDAAMRLDGTVVQVLFENLDTGRVSQLKGIATPPAQPSRASRTRKRRRFRRSVPLPNDNESSENDDKTASSRTLSPLHSRDGSQADSRTSIDDDSFGRLTPYNSPEPKRPRSASSENDDEEEDFWSHRHRVLRPNSPSRY